MEFLTQAKEVGIAIFAVGGAGYLIYFSLNKAELFFRKATESSERLSAELLRQLEENQTNYRSYVHENNHQKTEMLQQSIETMVEVKTSINQHNKILERIVDKLDRKL